MFSIGYANAGIRARRGERMLSSTVIGTKEERNIVGGLSSRSQKSTL